MVHLILLFALLTAAFVHAAPISEDLVVTLPDGKVRGAPYKTSNNKTYYGFRGIPFAAPPVGNLRLEHAAPISEDLVVTLPNGRIRGAAYSTPNNKTYYGFRGVPYATPPVGNLRFESPQPAKSWSGILNATEDSLSCITSEYFQNPTAENEDCLYINVYVPSLKSKKLPVMFWIHGGAFLRRSSSKSFYGPDFLIEENVIVVSFNYRLGPFGFISTGDSGLPGNLGMKDQNLALKWTYQNIEYFGGDQQKITIFGESAGGVSTGLHMISKKSAGLFRAVIAQSGSALMPQAVNRNPKGIAYALADAIPGGNYGNDTKKLKDFLKNKTVEEIMIATTQLSPGNILNLIFVPVLEVEGADAFLSESHYELLRSGNFSQVPLLIGICAEEYLTFLKDVVSTEAIARTADNNETAIIIPNDLLPNSTEEAHVIENIRSIYLSNGGNFSNNLKALVRMLSDNAFNTGILKHAELASDYIPVYLYQFAYYGRPFFQPFIEGAEKVGHGAELPFLFNIYNMSYTTDPGDLLTQKRMTTLWANFAKYLNPSPGWSELFENTIWPVFDKNYGTYLNINNTLEGRRELKADTYNKWNEIYETYGRKPLITF